MTASQTLAQSLSASPSATSYSTTQFSLPPSYHHEISDLSAYNRSFPPKIKCCVDRLSWLPKADNCGSWNVRSVPCVDGSELARAFFTFAALVGAAMCSAFKCGTRGRWP